MATIHLTQESPTLGALIDVRESAVEVASKLRTAARREDPSIRVHDHVHTDSVIIVPVRLIGPVTDR